jgi:hypothetical protein
VSSERDIHIQIGGERMGLSKLFQAVKRAWEDTNEERWHRERIDADAELAVEKSRMAATKAQAEAIRTEAALLDSQVKVMNVKSGGNKDAKSVGQNKVKAKVH